MADMIDGLVYGKRDDEGAKSLSAEFSVEAEKIEPDQDGFHSISFVKALPADEVKSRLLDIGMSAGGRISDVTKAGSTTKLVVGPVR